MFNLSEDKLFSTELVHGFPKDMINQIKNVLVRLDNFKIKGLSAIKGINEQYQISFKLEEIYKIVFDYFENKSMSLKFMTKENEQILNVNDVTEANDEKLSLIVDVISETIYRDNLISNTKKTK